MHFLRRLPFARPPSSTRREGTPKSSLPPSYSLSPLDFDTNRRALKRMSSRTSTRDLSAGYVKINESELQKAGLRGRKLIIVVVCLVALWILAVITLICNILLMRVLRMNHRGMESMQFMRLTEDEGGKRGDHLVQFTGEYTDLGTIMINSGVMAGFKNQDFKLVAGKVILESKDTKPPARMIVEGDRIKIENVKDFFVTSRRSEGEGNLANNGGDKSAAIAQTLFDSSKPTFRLKKSIKRLAGARIGTNRIRSPVNSNLTIYSSRDLTFHGSDGDMFEASSVRVFGHKSIIIRAEEGSIKLLGRGRAGVTLPRVRSLHESESPSLRADRLGLRLCVCRTTGKLFAVLGNSKCRIQEAYCH